MPTPLWSAPGDGLFPRRPASKTRHANGEAFAIGTLAGTGGILAGFAHRTRQIRDYDPRRPWRPEELERRSTAPSMMGCGGHAMSAMAETIGLPPDLAAEREALLQQHAKREP